MKLKVNYVENCYSDQCKCITAIIRTSLFAKYVCISLTFYHSDDKLYVTYGIKENGNEEIDDAHEYLLKPRFSFYLWNRNIEQHLRFPHLIGAFSNLSISDSSQNVLVARTIAKAFIDRFESIFETSRQSILNEFGKGVKKEAANFLDKIYFPYSKNTAKKILADLDWEKLLGKSEVTDCLKIIFQSNHPRIWPLSFEGKLDDIKILPKYLKTLDENDNSISLASILAMQLLREVVGHQKAELFRNTGVLLAESNGYKCRIKANERVSITDPKGNKAEACIHTQNFSCHPIDEVVISYLNITNCFEEWMKTANIFGDIETPGEKYERV